MKFRVGDVVVVEEESKEKIGIVTGDERDWWCLIGHIDVRFVGEDLGTIQDINSVVSFIPRELVDEWWGLLR